MNRPSTLADLPPAFLAGITAQLNGGRPLGISRARGLGAVEVVTISSDRRRTSGESGRSARGGGVPVAGTFAR